jgi:hypothetical protein
MLPRAFRKHKPTETLPDGHLMGNIGETGVVQVLASKNTKVNPIGPRLLPDDDAIGTHPLIVHLPMVDN